MEIGGIIGGIPIFMIFIFTGILINLIQVICYVTIRPVSKSKFRRINGAITELLWLESVWMMEWWSGFEVKLYTDIKTFRLMGKEHAIIMPNHVSDSDTLVTWVLAQRVGCLRSALTIVKKTTQYLPVFGLTTWFYEFIFVDRNWAKDESKLRSSFEALKDFPMPFWMIIFVEGTRLTPDKLLEAQAFASSKGYPIPKNVLIPKTKGIVTTVQSLRSFVPAIYDVTIAIPKNQPYFPTLLTFLKMQPCKDALLDQFATTGTFEEDEITEFRRSTKSLIVTVMFANLLLIGGWIYFQKLSTEWRYIILVTIVGVVAIIIHIFLEFTKLPPQKNKAA
ncbi:hypothetical protein V6N13_016461 [Hibiscus sabdariffa]